MKTIVCFFLCLVRLSTLSAQTIASAEYFFDSDPGVGKGVPLVGGTPDEVRTFSALIPTTSLTPGFHLLAVRAKDSDGKWSMFEWRTIYLSQTSSNVGTITAAEFFFDSDPGLGNGTSLGIPIPGHTVQFNAMIPITALQSGFHHLVVRTRDAAGIWSLFEARGFYISAPQSNVQGISAAEYFIDNDPGPGNGVPVTMGSGNVVTFTTLIPTASVSSGFHILAIRAKDRAGIWSIVETRGFYIQPTTPDMAPLIAAEYFLDADPGVGNGSPLIVATSGNIVSQNFLITLPASISNGQHLLAIRAKDANGVWGLLELTEITVSGFPLPLNWLGFTAKRSVDNVMLEWKTATEVNTSHFVIERSNNGTGFGKIGDVTAKGLSENNYGFTDVHPANGLNYYRLKQVDKDGQFHYSKIALVYFGNVNDNTLRLFPQPAYSKLNIAFGGRGKDVLIQVYDAAGKMLLSERKPNAAPLVIPTSQLTKGIYWIVVSDGTTLQKGQFLKQ